MKSLVGSLRTHFPSRRLFGRLLGAPREKLYQGRRDLEDWTIYAFMDVIVGSTASQHLVHIGAGSMCNLMRKNESEAGPFFNTSAQILQEF